MQEGNHPNTSIRHRHIHVQSRALGHIQIQGHRPIQNTFKYEINTRRPNEVGTPKGGGDTRLNLQKIRNSEISGTRACAKNNIINI